MGDAEASSLQRTSPRARRHSGPEPEPEAMDVDEPPREECLPPKLRKAWIAAKTAERLREQRHSETMSPAFSGGGEDMTDDVKEESYFGAWFVVAHGILLC